MTVGPAAAAAVAQTVIGEVDVLVVGGGQAALAAGYYLQRARRRGLTGLSFALLDAGTDPGGAWTGGWDRLQLFSPASFSLLPGWPMPVWPGEGNPFAAHVRAYLAAYEARYELLVHRPVWVSTVTRADGGGLEVVTDAGLRRCRVLVTATGAWGRPFWPTYPGMAVFAGRQLHTVDYRRAAEFEDQTVLVVGGGNSGAQIAADLTRRRHGPTPWVTARPPRFLPDDVDGRKLFEPATRQRGTATVSPQCGPEVYAETTWTAATWSAAATPSGATQQLPGKRTVTRSPTSTPPAEIEGVQCERRPLA